MFKSRWGIWYKNSTYNPTGKLMNIRTTPVRTAFRAALLMRALSEVHAEDLMARVNHPESGKIYANLNARPLATMIYLLEIDPESEDFFDRRLLNRAELLLKHGFQEEFRQRVRKNDPFVKSMVDLFPVER